MSTTLSKKQQKQAIAKEKRQAFAEEILSKNLFARLVTSDDEKIEWTDESDSRFRWSIRVIHMDEKKHEWRVTYDNYMHLLEMSFERMKRGERKLTRKEHFSLLVSKDSFIYEKELYPHGSSGENNLTLGDFYFMYMHIQEDGISYC